MCEWDKMSNEQLCIEYQKTKNEKLFEYFLNKNIGLVKMFKNRICLISSRFELNMVLQLCKITLLEAMLQFDLSKQVKFSTFYALYIKHNLQEFRNEYRLVRFPHSKVSWVLSKNNVKSIINVDNLADYIEDYNMLKPDEVLENKEELQNAICTFKSFKDKYPKYYNLLSLYFGLENNDIHTLDEISKIYNVTKQAISRSLITALNKLKNDKHNKIKNLKDLNSKLNETRSFKLNPKTDKRFGPKLERQKPNSKRHGEYKSKYNF